MSYKAPQTALEDIPANEVQEITANLKALHDLGRPQTDQEVEERIDDFFRLCQTTGIRPGIESLCCALQISRTTLFNWSNGQGCSQERQQLIIGAKSLISAYIEQASLTGKINPASGIFLMKNWCGYKDSISLDEAMPATSTARALSTAELPRLAERKN